jgi:hypothetical protein
MGRAQFTHSPYAEGTGLQTGDSRFESWVPRSPGASLGGKPLHWPLFSSRLATRLDPSIPAPGG